MLSQSPLSNLIKDRRKKRRDARDRRRSQRWRDDRIIHWRHESESQTRTGRLIARSLDGFVVLIDTNDIASPVHRLVAVDGEGAQPCGFRTAVVRRHDITCEGVLLYAEVES
ncbi:MAG TPA: hypothetical protein P5081_01185 [Phycisphaerae bacterium]|nr:hypothetical protein [Phycisphaerae bacterium]HRW51467.1 hypothetical protein [Phycisphaerae bacterium]